MNDDTAACPASLTTRQQSVLDCIWSRVQKRKCPPSIRDIGDKLGGMAPNGVHGHLLSLRRKGWIDWDYAAGRTLRLTRAARKALSGFPLVEMSEITER